MMNDVSGHLFNVAVQQDPFSHYLYIILFIIYYLCTKFQYRVFQISVQGVPDFGTGYTIFWYTICRKCVKESREIRAEESGRIEDKGERLSFLHWLNSG